MMGRAYWFSCTETNTKSCEQLTTGKSWDKIRYLNRWIHNFLIANRQNTINNKGVKRLQKTFLQVTVKWKSHRAPMIHHYIIYIRMCMKWWVIIEPSLSLIDDRRKQKWVYDQQSNISRYQLYKCREKDKVSCYDMINLQKAHSALAGKSITGEQSILWSTQPWLDFLQRK